MMDDEDGWVNPTLAMLAEVADEPRTVKLRRKLDGLLEGHGVDAILAAVIPLLVEIHLNAHSDDENRVCITCANASLTELFQAMRVISDDITGDMDGDGDCS